MQASVFCRGRPLTVGACFHQSARCMATSSSSVRCMTTGSSSAPVKVAFIGAGEPAPYACSHVSDQHFSNRGGQRGSIGCRRYKFWNT